MDLSEDRCWKIYVYLSVYYKVIEVIEKEDKCIVENIFNDKYKEEDYVGIVSVYLNLHITFLKMQKIKLLLLIQKIKLLLLIQN